VALIDTSKTMLAAGSDAYLKEIITSSLNEADRASLSMAYLSLRQNFGDHELLRQIDQHLLDNPTEITDNPLEVTLDLSQKTSWDKTLTMHVDGQPFEHAGKGEQSKIKALLALRNRSSTASVILFEEPENNLSFSSMRQLINKIIKHSDGKQLFVSSHSSYVINKLGLQNLILFSKADTKHFKELPQETYDYFKKLPGFDTLRVILAKKAILVEGPSDELIVQRAYMDKNQRLPLDDGIDVIGVKGLSFKRFLDIAKLIGLETVVVTDNDGDIQTKITNKYRDYATDFTIHYSTDESLVTLEPNIVAANSLQTLNAVLGKEFGTKQEAIDYMISHKTTAALKIFDSTTSITYPDYIKDAIE